MLHTGRLLPLTRARRAEHTEFGREGNVSQIGLIIGQSFHDLLHADTTPAGRMMVFLCAGDLAGVAAGAVFVVDEEAVFRSLSLLPLDAMSGLFLGFGRLSRCYGRRFGGWVGPVPPPAYGPGPSHAR